MNSKLDSNSFDFDTMADTKVDEFSRSADTPLAYTSTNFSFVTSESIYFWDFPFLPPASIDLLHKFLTSSPD